MMRRALTRRRFVALGGACTVIATGVSAAAHSLAGSVERNTLTFGLVQSALWPVDPQHARVDLQRNAERMAETIHALGPRCAWLAFHDRALTGGASLETGAVSIHVLDSLFDIVATAAKSTSCWVSFGAPKFGSAESAVQRDELPVALSPRGERFHGPWIDSSLGRIGLAIGEPSSSMIAEAQRAPALAVITMAAGPRPARPASTLGAHAAHGTHRLEVSAAHADLRLDCPTQWLGGSAAFDGTGKLLGRCAGSSEEILLVALRAV